MEEEKKNALCKGRMRNTTKKPLMMLGLMTMIGAMIGAMIVIMIVFSMVGDMGEMMFGTSALGMMVMPLAGLIIMVPMMVLSFRKMAGSRGPMSMVSLRSHEAQHNGERNNLTVLNYNIPAVSCGHCKANIEHEIGKLAGVASVNVDLDSKQAVIELDPPPVTKAEIEALLAEIGYPPGS
jgi:copper chaperone CopZ